jgi:hypothetical protein
MKVLLVLMTALILAPAAGAYGRFPLIEQVASEIAGRPVEVRCGYADDWHLMAEDPNWAGYAQWADGRPVYAALNPIVCWSLMLLAADPDNTVASTLSDGNNIAVSRQGESVLILAHEAVHMAGVWDEGQTECRALNYIDMVIARFGATGERAEMLKRHAEFAHLVAPPAYRSVC